MQLEDMLIFQIPKSIKGSAAQQKKENVQMEQNNNSNDQSMISQQNNSKLNIQNSNKSSSKMDTSINLNINGGGTSSNKTSAPSTCIKIPQNKHSQYRYSGSPDNQNEFDDSEDHHEEKLQKQPQYNSHLNDSQNESFPINENNSRNGQLNTNPSIQNNEADDSASYDLRPTQFQQFRISELEDSQYEYEEQQMVQQQMVKQHPQFFRKDLQQFYVQNVIEEKSETSSYQTETYNQLEKQMDNFYDEDDQEAEEEYENLGNDDQQELEEAQELIEDEEYDQESQELVSDFQKQSASSSLKKKNVKNQHFQYIMKNFDNENLSRQHNTGYTDEQEAFLFDSLNSFYPKGVTQVKKEQNNQQLMPEIQLIKHQSQTNRTQNKNGTDANTYKSTANSKSKNQLQQQQQEVAGSGLASQMQITLQQVVANFAQEKQMTLQLNEYSKENAKLKEENNNLKGLIEDKDHELDELRIQIKELEIRLCHSEGQLKRERQDKENNALAFKRILANLTSSSKDNATTTLSSINGIPTSQKKMNARKLSTQFEIHSSIGNQSQFKFLMGDTNFGTTGTITGGMISKTLENENTLGAEFNTLDQISKLKNQLTNKEEELQNLRKQHRRAGNQSVWWFNNRGQHNSKNYFNQSGSAGYSPLPTQPSVPSNYHNPLIETNVRGSSKKPQKAYQQQYQMLSPMQGSPILSNNGSVSSWVNKNSQIQASQIGQFVLLRDDKHSLTEVPPENSFDILKNDKSQSLIRDIFLDKQDYTQRTVPQPVKRDNQYEIQFDNLDEDLQNNDDDFDDEQNADDLGQVCKNEEKKLDMMISGGDYSPNSHTFFKQPFNKDQKVIETLQYGNKLQVNPDQIRDQKLVVLNKCPKQQNSKHHRQNSTQVSAVSNSRRIDTSQDFKSQGNNYSSILSIKTKVPDQKHQQQSQHQQQPNLSPLQVFQKQVQTRQQSRKQSPLGSLVRQKDQLNHHSTLDNSDLMTQQQIQNLRGSSPHEDRTSTGLGPHNTLGTTIVTTTNATNTSNISPFKQGKRLIPDSLVKMPLRQQNNNKKSKEEVEKSMNISKYQSIKR
ncbi:UNKNOWN [Stylonychia lemnae]|uniref:Uncharacterized protein n=1 Tax=Stylonychia lemnae TaxID=5949 RepID=A0A078ALS6_STYLE|nr:UNKNOWN [Stylonychia lemnae]|eukprot:CDW83305.1 UNKNOWN [Stylonychia lemnae]